MNICIDLHGTIDSDPKVFLEKVRRWICKGHFVYVLSGPPEEKIKEELDALGFIHYHKIISVVDYLKSIGTNMWQYPSGKRPDDWWCSEEDWWSSKAKICKDRKIDLLIDNEFRYQKYFEKIETLFVSYEKDNATMYIF